MSSFSVSNILGKAPGDPKLEDLYKIDKQLGKGAFGVVKLGINKKTGAQVAIKSISKAKLVCKEDVKDVQAEVAIMNLVAGHQCVVTLMSTFEDKDAVHLCMELCGGGELFDSIVEAGSFTERKAATIFKKMVDTIHHCHELGVMHRDLKPENFLLTSKGPDGELKLTDFGLGVFFKPGERFRDLVGSPYYVAPEVLRKNYSHEADMWSLGVILYILLSGLPPFWGDTEEQIFKMVLRGHIDFKTDPWPKISEAAKDCVRRLLEQDPAKRATTQQILTHDWLVKEGAANDVVLDSVVLKRMRQFAQMNKLKKMCLMVVGQHLSPDEIAGLKELFKSIDEDKSGTISVEEMRKALSQWGHKIGEAELQALISIADVDGDGLIDYNEFVASTMHLSKLEKEEVLQKTFMQLDRDGSGTISIDELSAALRQFGVYDDAATLLATADKNGDGSIDYCEFCAMMRNQNEGLRTSRSQMKNTGIRF
uniref:Calcium-dependent protein kinase n=1 Tax=Chlamydomonas leiostraca TaxID=1034604 RepID=A0A7S0RNC7_9CHLO|mmetsp:Transcript_27513/g.70029  ORF Transcript_27513/g.70029 Transcript_27513/m.70029 type:complete len:480 (+) Transcript_27513:196-1635(+)|eukprot:CAMPEP_0202867280 /NCGR_PEP_ID=MMETSP1391-20130828/9093_1 /ASSEMBLY_ACC=CAM_ASM_000867 /TAXON_ID=1034604 /ORGANISM="Chlamydomonas leiostraca, Strain SAG 11-49" /LENGTH=479 /DNA_ID=CAMNT_0049547311 /DNA_START=194 /DNA_END=1633 /DNA_ORIENTATION=+